MSTIVKLDPADKYRIFTKGASEIVLGLCTSYITNDMQRVAIDQEVKRDLNAQIEDMAQKGLRTICIAYAELPEHDEGWVDQPPEHDLTCIALVGIKDPVRPEVPRAVRQCQRAGIMVRMVTGDNLATARTIARECGILTDGIAMEGHEFRALTEQQMDRILPTLQVLARSTPIDKHTLVKRLKENGEVVAVTGDGTNDAPALNEAHVGLAMGIAGTDVAKEASDIIILDDNFSSIVSAVLWGRCVFDNIRKFLQFQLTINLVALTTAFLAAVTGRGLPLKTVQLLWVNLIMDTLAALALGTETPTPDLLDRKPYGSKERLISPIMIRNIIVQFSFQLFLLLGLLYAGPELLHLPYQDDDSDDPNKLTLDTMVFNTFVFLQIFNEFNARLVTNSLNPFKGVFKNFIFVGIIIVTAILQALIVEFGGSFIETTHLTAAQWGICLLLGLLSIPLGFIQRLIPVDNISFFSAPSEETKPLLSVGAKDKA
jgi:Ca2+-transporting ATPase